MTGDLRAAVLLSLQNMLKSILLMKLLSFSCAITRRYFVCLWEEFSSSLPLKIIIKNLVLCQQFDKLTFHFTQSLKFSTNFAQKELNLVGTQLMHVWSLKFCCVVAFYTLCEFLLVFWSYLPKCQLDIDMVCDVECGLLRS